jgi:hypothetical protein
VNTDWLSHSGSGRNWSMEGGSSHQTARTVAQDSVTRGEGGQKRQPQAAEIQARKFKNRNLKTEGCGTQNHRWCLLPNAVRVRHPPTQRTKTTCSTESGHLRLTPEILDRSGKVFWQVERRNVDDKCAYRATASSLTGDFAHPSTVFHRDRVRIRLTMFNDENIVTPD